jgi:hypothetical protein
MTGGAAAETGAPAGSPAGTPCAVAPRTDCSLPPAPGRRVVARIVGTPLAIAGPELTLLVAALGPRLRRRHGVPTVEIDAAQVRAATRAAAAMGATQFSRQWASVTLRGPRGRRPGRLLIESHGRACEIGAFLTREERRASGRRQPAPVARAGAAPPLAPTHVSGDRCAPGADADRTDQQSG